MAGKNIKFLEKILFKLNFTKKLMTPYGGFALLAKPFEKLELKEHIEQPSESFGGYVFPIVQKSNAIFPVEFCICIRRVAASARSTKSS